MQKDQPPSKEDILREEVKSDPDAFKDRWGVPDDPDTPPPPSEGPTKQ